MVEISGISFKGIAQNQAPVSAENNLTQGFKELGVQALPSGDKSLAINPSLPSEFLGEADLERYKKIQAELAKSLSERWGIPVENLLARIPETEIGDKNEMLIYRPTVAEFDHKSNRCRINPVREIADFQGSDGSKIVHESVHGIDHNLKKAYVQQMSPRQFYQESANTVAKKMLQGEHGPIINGLQVSNVNGQVVCIPMFMTAPSLSAKEREALLSTLNSLRDEHLDLKTAKLNDAGKTLVKEKLLPHLTDYSKHIIAEAGKKDEAICKEMTDYINSFYTRTKLLISDLISPQNVSLEKSLKTQLTEAEETIAKKSLSESLSTLEGTAIRQYLPGTSDNSLKSYFTSYGELLAIGEENRFRLDELNQKIKDISQKGTEIKPAANLLLEKQTVEANLKILELIHELNNIEKRIIASEKSPEKLLEIAQIKQKIGSLIDTCRERVNIDINVQPDGSIFVNTKNDVIKTIEQNVAPEIKEQPAFIIKNLEEMQALSQKLNELNSPEKLLADTIDNKALKSKFDGLINEIKELSTKCDLVGMPEQFFKDIKHSIKLKNISGTLFTKWAKRIRI